MLDFNNKINVETKFLGSLVDGGKSAISTIYTDFVRTPLYNKRANSIKYNDVDIELHANGVTFKKNNKVVPAESVIKSNSQAIEIVEEINILKSINQFSEIIEDKLTDLEIRVEDIENPDQTTLLKYWNVSKEVSDEDVRRLLNEILVEKCLIKSNKNILRALEFIRNLSKEEIRKMQELKKLLLLHTTCTVSINPRKAVLSERQNNILVKRNVLNGSNGKEYIFESNYDLYIPFIKSNKMLENFDIKLNYNDVMEFSSKGIYNFAPLAAQFHNKKNDNNYRVNIFRNISENSDLLIFNGINDYANVSIFRLTELGTIIFNNLPNLSIDQEKYFSNLNKYNIFGNNATIKRIKYQESYLNMINKIIE